MKINAILPEKGRDLRLDLFRGVANWAIYLDHIPDNVVNWITTRNYGFSDAADLFVFISGYTASFVYARMMLDRGFTVGATRLTKRVWQLYVAHIILFVIYIAAITYLALKFGDSEIINEFNVAGLIENAPETLRQGLFLKFKPVNLDVLPLYIVLMGLFPPVLWLMLRQPDVMMIGSIVLWLVARQMGWNLPAYPGGAWYFNPFAWQVLFVFGSWCALGGARKSIKIIQSPYTLYFCIAYMILALVMTMAGKFPDFGALFPHWLYSTFNPNDKTFLAPYRFLHFVVIVILVIRFVPTLTRSETSPNVLSSGATTLCIGFFDTSVSCSTKVSMPVVRKQCTASSGVSTIGSPLTLKEVLISTGTPVNASNSFSRRY